MFWASAKPEMNFRASSFSSKVVVYIYVNLNENLNFCKVISYGLWHNLKWFSIYQWRLEERLVSRTFLQGYFCSIIIIDYKKTLGWKTIDEEKIDDTIWNVLTSRISCMLYYLSSLQLNCCKTLLKIPSRYWWDNFK